MKLLPYLLINVVVVAGGIAVYDQLQGDEPAPVVEDAEAIDFATYERRLAALEAERQPLLRAQGPDARVVERLDALEARLAKLAASRGPPPSSVDPQDPLARLSTPVPGATEEPTPEAVERFRKLQEAARREQILRVQRARVGTRLEKAGIRLSEKQQEQVVEAHVSFQPRHREIWTEVKSRVGGSGGEPDWRAVVAETTAVVRREFAERLSSFLPAGDADAVATAMYATGK